MNGVEALRLGQVADPRPGPGETLLRVRVAALNPADAFLAQGLYPAHPHLPHVLGRDGVGDVLDVGPGVDNALVGETVGILRGDVGIESWGTLAEKVLVPMENLARIPQGWSLEEMAGAPLVLLTAYQALTQWNEPAAAPRPQSVLLVTGASGGVGIAAVLLGKSMGLTVVALSRSEEKRSRLRALGADCVYDPGDRNLVDAIKKAIGPRRVDIVVDSVGGALLHQVIAVVGYGGRISIVGRSGGPVPEFNTASLLFRRIRMGGVAVGDYKAKEAQAVWNEIVDRLNALGRRPVVDSVVPFEEVKAAFARLAQGSMGKVLVRVAE